MSKQFSNNKKQIFTSLVVGLFVVSACAAFISPVQAALPAGFETETIAAGLSTPTSIAFSPDGRIFIAEKAGAVKIVKNGALLPTPLIQLTDVNTYADRGLIGIAVDPNFLVNKYLYLSYTYENTPGSNFAGRKTARIVRVTVNGDTASESSKVIIVGTVGGNNATPSCEDYPVTADCIASDSSSHSAGGLRFGPDGKLYATLGEGANFDVVDPRSMRAQNIDSLAGKMIRINTDGTAPTDNPFYNGDPTANRSKVYAYGLRNMFRFNFRPSTGALYGGDVGWDTWEEINLIVPGSNYGWPCREGNNQAVGQTCTAPNYVNPFYNYIHDPIKGGAVVLGAFPGVGAYPAQYDNTMFFGDYALNWIKLMTLGPTETLVSVTDFMTPTDGANGPVEFVTGPDGRIYFISIYTGELRRINYTLGNRQPIAQITANPTSGSLPLTVNFSSAGSSDPDGNPLTYLWNFGDLITSTQANPQHVYNVAGNYLASLKVTDGLGGVSIKNITINAGNQAPTPTITSPLNGDVYVVGENLSVAGSATDPEDGALSGTALSWRAILHHNTHVHVLETHTGSTFQMVAPDHSDPDVYMELELTATDSGGVSAKTSINMYLNNSVTPDGNWIQNRSFEEADPLNPALPNHWLKGGWGTNTRTLTYPVTGFEGASSRAAKVTITGYSSGDAKWYFDPAAVKENKDFAFSDYYISTVPSKLVAAVSYIDGSTTYHELATLPVSAVWTQAQATFKTPVGAKKLTIFHSIAANGTLTVDNYSLTPLVVAPPSSNLILNPSLETAAGTVPQSWLSGGWGTNTRTFTYPVAAQDGAKAARVVVSGYSNGDAKWYFQDVAVTPGTTYTFSDYYQSTVASQLFARFQSTPGVFTYQSLGTLPVSAAWVQTTKPITIPAGTTSLTVFHLLAANGSLTVDNYSLTAPSGAPDTTAPVVSISAPAPTTVVSGTTTTVSANATDNVGVVGVQFKLDGVNLGAEDTSAPYSIVWDTTTATNAGHTLTAVARDAANNSTTSAGVAVTVNNVTGANLITNGFMETANGANPLGWTPVFTGAITTTFTYPTVGVDGGKAASIAITSFPPGADGNARWQFDDVPISTGVEYTYEGYYKGSTISDIIGRYTFNDNSEHFFGLKKEIPAASNWTFITGKFVGPVNVKSITLMHLISTQATLSIDNAKLYVSGTGVPNEIIPPEEHFTNPLDGQTVSGVVTLTADATDNVGVAGLFFAVDGTPLGPEMTAPFTQQWDSTTVPNGVHTLKVTARDAVGNNSRQIISVTVNNVTPPPSSNLILNPSLETANGTTPQSWFSNKWGTHTATFTYPVAGQDGAKAAKVVISGYSSGDAKWYFQDVAVTPGTTYTFSDYYQSTIPSELFARFTSTTGTLTYQSLGTLPTSAAWVQTTKSIVIPAGTASLTVFHVIAANGSLTVDNYSLTAPSGAPDTTAPIVSISAPTPGTVVSGTTTTVSATASDNVGVVGVQFKLDGVNLGAEDTIAPYSIVWDTTTATNASHTLTAVARDAANNSTTSAGVAVMVNNAPLTNLVLNPSLETAAGSLPQNWYQDFWGTNTRTFTYPVTGFDGAKAAKVAITAYTDGDAKWAFDHVNLVAGKTYTFSDRYQANVATYVVAEYTMADNSLTYQDIGTVPVSTAWGTASFTITPPAGAKSMTVFHLLQAVGNLTVDLASVVQQ